jgi:hypothetical protein
VKGTTSPISDTTKKRTTFGTIISMRDALFFFFAGGMIYKEEDPNPGNFVPALIYRQLERLWPRRFGSVAEMSYAFGMLSIRRGLDEAVHATQLLKSLTINVPQRQESSSSVLVSATQG